MKIKHITKLSRKFTKYDLETQNHNFIANGIVIHNSNARYVFNDGQMYCGSRTMWKKDKQTNIWWRAFRNTPAIQRFCTENRNCVLYGEVYGSVQNLKYGCDKDVRFAAFDMLRDGSWIDAESFMTICEAYEIPMVPVIHRAWPLDKSIVTSLAEGPSLMPGATHVREGCVIKPVMERTDPTLGRLILKIVGEGYYNAK